MGEEGMGGGKRWGAEEATVLIKGMEGHTVAGLCMDLQTTASAYVLLFSSLDLVRWQISPALLYLLDTDYRRKPDGLPGGGNWHEEELVSHRSILLQP